jgi:pSer/pThr/pTyr-binding forkhead associated (FHA) protein
MEILLLYQSSEGLKEMSLHDGSLSFGRGGDADIRLDDSGLSRLNSTIYREQERIWILDENSTNGTFVNGSEVSPNGTILKAGDVIKIGNSTEIRLKISSKKQQEKPVAVKAQTAKITSNSNNHMVLPILAVMIGVFVISVSALVIGVKIYGSKPAEVVQIDKDFDEPIAKPIKDDEDPKVNPTPKETLKANSSQTSNEANTSLTNSPTANNVGTQPNIPSGKKYQEMSEAEKRQYIKTRAEKVARMIGNQDGNAITEAAITIIRRFLDGYTQKLRSPRKNDCSARSWLSNDMVSILERASKNSPFIVHAFNSEGIDPQIGIYIAMIESEHCVCLQSGTGPLGMFQFTKATGEAYGLKVRKGATPANADERCEPAPAARASAKYMKFLQGRYGTDPSSVPLAIGSYNSGEGGLSKNLMTALNSNQGLPRDFWSLIANGEKLSKQFQSENFKYVPKFFAAAIIGENPTDFGVSLQPLSTYTK